jgi:hypothetical protein
MLTSLFYLFYVVITKMNIFIDGMIVVVKKYMTPRTF